MKNENLVETNESNIISLFDKAQRISESNASMQRQNAAELDSYIDICRTGFYKERDTIINDEININDVIENMITTIVNEDIDDGIENRIKKYINKSNTWEELVNNIKTKRYTYNKINRMLLHILIGLTKQDNKNTKLDYLKILGFTFNGQVYLNKIKKDITLPTTPPKKYTNKKR